MNDTASLNGERPLSELIADPIVAILMARDGVTKEQLDQVLDRARAGPARPGSPLLAGSPQWKR